MVYLYSSTNWNCHYTLDRLKLEVTWNFLVQLKTLELYSKESKGSHSLNKEEQDMNGWGGSRVSCGVMTSHIDLAGNITNFTQ